MDYEHYRHKHRYGHRLLCSLLGFETEFYQALLFLKHEATPTADLYVPPNSLVVEDAGSLLLPMIIVPSLVGSLMRAEVNARQAVSVIL